MVTSKEVFAKRKEGDLVTAYNMARELIDKDPNDDWNFKAYAWCLIDLIKLKVSENNQELTQRFSGELKEIDISPSDAVLTKSVNYALSISDPSKASLNKAKQLSKQGQHKEAIQLLQQALAASPNDRNIHDNLGWEYYRLAKPIFSQDNINTFPAKKILSDYIRLENERPSILHSLFLRFADKLVGSNDFNLVSFLQYWDLKNLREEDYERFVADDGKSFPSIAEKVIQHGAKGALNSNNLDHANYILPFVDSLIIRFSENQWLTYYKAKLLNAIGKHEEAVEFSIKVVKNKPNDFWTWGLLGSILSHINIDEAFSCYCRALSCRTDDKFLTGLRVEFSELLIKNKKYSEAKFEIDKAINAREREGWKIPESLSYHRQADWYKKTEVIKSNKSFYNQNLELANSLLFKNLEWLNASVGESFTIPDKPGKPKRKLYIQTNKFQAPIEIVVPENKYDFAKLKPGSGLKLKGEYDAQNRFQVFVIESRESGDVWDILSNSIAVIDHINTNKNIAHYLVNKTNDGVANLSEFPKDIAVGDVLALKLVTFESRQGKRNRVLSARLTSDLPSSLILKKFSENVRVSNGFGFTNSNIFIEKTMVSQVNIQDGESVKGVAIINFNKKKNEWSWKALSLTKVETNSLV
jgi:tetratricopeptide (TPR) repeat protein